MMLIRRGLQLIIAPIKLILPLKVCCMIPRGHKVTSIDKNDQFMLASNLKLSKHFSLELCNGAPF